MSEILHFSVEPVEAGSRLDAFLSVHMPQQSRSILQKWMEQELVLVNDATAPKNRKLRCGDQITVMVPEPEPAVAQPENIPLEIVFEDAELLVVNKPKGMVVHPAPGNPDHTLVNALLYHCQGQLSGIGGVLRPGIVHRIDKDTSGLLMIAKTDRAHQGLAAQIQDHRFFREYAAVVYGNVKADTGTVDAPIGRSKWDRKKMAVTREHSKPAVTHYTVLQRYQGFTYLQCRLETGRTHQIRVHMASIGHPLAGDAVYGPQKVIHSLQGQCLHAQSIGFVHPVTGESLRFTSELPEYFTSFLHSLRPLA